MRKKIIDVLIYVPAYLYWMIYMGVKLVRTLYYLDTLEVFVLDLDKVVASVLVEMIFLTDLHPRTIAKQVKIYHEIDWNKPLFLKD